MTFLIIIFVVIYGFFAWRRLDLAAALLIAVLPVYQIRFSFWILPMTLLEAMILILFAVWLFKSWQAGEFPLLLSFPPASPKLQRGERKRESKKYFKRYPFSLEIILLLIIAFVSTAVAGFSSSALGILKAYFIEPIMFFVVFVNIFKYRESRDKIFWALAVSVFIVSAIAIYQRITGSLMPPEWAGAGRITGVFAYPNGVGLYLGPIIVLLVGYLVSLRNPKSEIPARSATHSVAGGRSPKQYQNSKSQILNILFFCFLVFLPLAAIYLAKSEGALAGVAAGLFIFGLLYNKKSRWVMAGLAVLIVGGIAVNGAVRDYAIGKIMLRDLDGQIRRQMWTETWEMLKDGRVVSGAGLANYQSAVAPYHQEGIFVQDYNDPDWRRKVVFNDEFKKQAWQPLEIYLYPHNLFLNFWSELGLAGSLLFVWIVAKFFVISYKLLVINNNNNNKFILMGLLGAMIVVIVHGLVDAPYFKNDLAVIFWMLIGMMGVLKLQTANFKL